MAGVRYTKLRLMDQGSRILTEQDSEEAVLAPADVEAFALDTGFGYRL